jgi:hypothetical protein
MVTNETALVKVIRTAIAQEFPGAWQMKVHGGPYQQVGVPDLLVVNEGHLFAFEVKHQKPGESLAHVMDRVSPTQWIEIHRIHSAGGTAEVITSASEAITIMRNYHGHQSREVACHTGSHQARP